MEKIQAKNWTKKMMPEKNTCPICGGSISKEEWIGHINMGPQAHVHLYKAFCDSCQIWVERRIEGGEDSGWLSSTVDIEDIAGELSREELDQVEKRLVRYPTLSTQWKEFIAQKQGSDTVCRFKELDMPYTGLTIKRGNHLIGRFSSFGDL